jgi:D-alanyl-D-alanine carboxypeptidase
LHDEHSMNIKWLTAIALLAPACVVGSSADDATGDDDTIHDPNGDPVLRCALEPESFQAELAAAVAANAGQGGGILRVECDDGTLLWEGAAGDVAEDDPTALVPGDAFEIQSTTKPLTAALVLTFVDDGRITLDTPLGMVLPATDTRGLLVISGHDYGPELTVRQLLQHTAGLPDYWNDGPFGDDDESVFQRAYNADENRLFHPREVLDYARQLTPISRPGGAHHYSDTGYVLLGLVAEALGGKPYHTLLRERIFTPLGMTATYLRYLETPSPEPVVAAWYDEGALIAGTVHQSADWAGGGLVSTAADLAKFARGLARGKVVKPATLAAMRTFVPTATAGIDYGLGLFRVDFAKFDQPERGAWEGHDGFGAAFMYSMKPGIVVTGTLNNAQAEDAWGTMVEAVQAAFLAQ